MYHNKSKKSSDKKLSGNSLCERLVIPDKSQLSAYKNVRNCKKFAGIVMVIYDFTGR